MQEYCPPLFEFPGQPIAWNDLHLFYSSNRTYTNELPLEYICFNDQFCNSWSFTMRISKISEPTTLLSCQIPSKIGFMIGFLRWEAMLQILQRISIRICASTKTDVQNDCPEATQFRCGKKCLSKHRLVDYRTDCIDDSDEEYNDSCVLNDKYRTLCTYQQNGVYVNICIKRVLALTPDGKLVCDNHQKLPHFPTLCDGYVEYHEIINREIETDETNCEEWLCDNQYTRCDGIWNCLNGADEIPCIRQFCNNENAHPCVLWNSSRPICLPISRAGDEIIDCVGATDERHLCRNNIDIERSQENMYRCQDSHNHDEQMTNQ